MDTTRNLDLPLIVAAQAQKHVTHNEALTCLDAIVHIAIPRDDLATPPAAPADGDRYLVAVGASDAWLGQAGRLAAWQNGAWRFFEPRPGWMVYRHDTASCQVFDGADWQPIGGAATDGASLWGVNATADATHRLVVAAPASLFTHEGGDHRLAINKAAGADTAALLFQTDWSGRAEIGLAGSDDLALRVSEDGSLWRSGVIVAGDGGVSLPFTPLADNLVINGNLAINQRGFAGGGLAAGAFGPDRWNAGVAGASLTSSAGEVTLDGEILQAIESALWSDVAGTAFTVTVTDLQDAAMEVTLDDAVVTLDPAAGPVSAVLEPSAAGPFRTMRLRTTVGPVRFRNVALVTGAPATAPRLRSLAEELWLCRRYFAKSYELATTPGDGLGSPGYTLGVCYSDGNIASQRIMLSPPMRTPPSVVFHAPNTGNPVAAGRWQALGPSVSYQNADSMALAENASTGFVVNLGVTGSLAGSAYLACGGWSASAEP